MASLRRSSATFLLLLAAARQTTGQRHVPITTNRVYSWDARDIGGVPGPRGPSAPGGSACDPGASQPLGFACVHMAMLSDDMLAAARYDRLDREFIYAVAGAGSDSNCGECYQVQPVQSERLWRSDFKQLIVQVINSGSDVASGQLDIMMGAGGMGIFTAVNSDCQNRHCNGGPCNSVGMFDGDFDAWAPDGQCYGGGVRALNASEAVLTKACRALSAGKHVALKDRILFDTCTRTNRELWHQNFVRTRYTRVRCPAGLYRLTGLRRSDDDHSDLPDPHVENDLWQACDGGNGPCISTMHDGCMPSCAWDGKGSPSGDYPRVDRCDRDNHVMTA